MNQILVFQNIRIFDGTHVLEDNTIIIQDDTITAVGKDLVPPQGAKIVDGSGLTLLPGLIDSHIHTFTITQLQQAAIFGVTTALDMGTYWKGAQGIKKLQGTNDGQDLADLRSSGTMITAPGGHGTEYGIPIPTLSESDDVQNFVDARIAEGADYIKIVYDNRIQKSGKPEPTLSKETMAAVIKAAHKRDKLTVVHISKLQEAQDAIEAGTDGLAHVFTDELPEEKFYQLAHSAGVFIIPTLTIREYLAGIADNKQLIDSPLGNYLSITDKEKLQLPFPYKFGNYHIGEQVVQQLKKLAVPILAGTDSGGGGPMLGPMHGISLHRELELLVKAGLTPIDVLAAATSVPAHIFGLSDRGIIAEGKRADLLLVKGDPTRDIKATRAIEGVWKQGKEIDREAYLRHMKQQQLQQMLEKTLYQEIAEQKKKAGTL